MAFVDRVVEYPNRVVLTPVAGETDTYDLTFSEGTITEAGTPLNAANLNGEIADAIADGMQAFTIDANDNVSFRNFQSGRAKTQTTAAKQTKTINVSFPQAFTQTPIVTVSTYSTNPTQVVCSVSSVTTTGFTIYVYATVARTCNIAWMAHV